MTLLSERPDQTGTELHALPAWRVRSSLMLGLGGQTLYLFCLSRAAYGTNTYTAHSIFSDYKELLPALAALGCISAMAGLMLIVRVRIVGLLGLILVASMLLGAVMRTQEFQAEENQYRSVTRVRKKSVPTPSAKPLGSGNTTTGTSTPGVDVEIDADPESKSKPEAEPAKP